MTLRTLCGAVTLRRELLELAALSGLPRHIVGSVPAASIEYSSTTVRSAP